MKRWKKMFISLLTICMFSGLSTMSVLAAEGEPYTYTVTLSAGNKGTINGAEMEVTSGWTTTDTVRFDLSKVTVTDDRYYVKGVRLSGHDNETALGSPAFPVTGDADYVVAYGIKGNMVAYTVTYQDEDGNELAPSDTFYGNVGDKVVVPYKYIEDFVPNALAATKTLSVNEAENVFPFTYIPGDPGTITETVITTTTTTGTTVITTPAETTGGTAAGTAGAAGTTGAITGTTAGTAAGPGATPDAGADTEADTQDDETTTADDEQTPQSLIDLDDEETPTSNIDASEDEPGKKGPMAIGIAIIAASLAALGVLLVFLKKRAK